MLRQLAVHNIVLVERLELEFEPFSAQDAERYQVTANVLLTRPGAYRRRFRVRRERSSPEHAPQPGRVEP